VVGIFVEDLLEQVQRAGASLKRRKATSAPTQLEIGRVHRRDQRHLAGQQIVEVLPALGRGVVALERAEVAQVVLLQGQELAQGGDGVVAVVQHRLVDLGDLREQLDLVLGLGSPSWRMLSRSRRSVQRSASRYIRVRLRKAAKCSGSRVRISL
jgi:hypothetical protein